MRLSAMISLFQQVQDMDPIIFGKNTLGYISNGPDEDGDYLVRELSSTGNYKDSGPYFKQKHFKHGK